MGRIRNCSGEDFARILTIINAAAEAYRGIIPPDCWHEPYMAAAELKQELAASIRFVGFEEAGSLLGVMGIQTVGKFDLIRHAYVLPDHQGRGIGGQLLEYLQGESRRPIMIGTWAAAIWAIRFYERHGFRLVAKERMPVLLRPIGA